MSNFGNFNIIAGLLLVPILAELGRWSVYQWIIVIGSGATVLTLIYIAIALRVWDWLRLRFPLRVYFLIPKYSHYQLKYYPQDEDEHLLNRLSIPANQEVCVFLWIKSNTSFLTRDMYFGCKGGECKPKVYYFNPFIVESNIKQEWYIDWHSYYHLMEFRARTRGDVHVAGFKVYAPTPGEYTAELLHHLEKGASSKLVTNKLKLVVVTELNHEKAQKLAQEVPRWVAEHGWRGKILYFMRKLLTKLRR